LTDTGFRFLYVGLPTTEHRTISMSDVSDFEVDAKHLLLFVGTSNGFLRVVDMRTLKSHEVSLCNGALNHIAGFHRDLRIAYTCHNGDAGVWDDARQKSSLLTHLEGGSFSVAVSSGDDYVLLGGSSCLLRIYDSHTRLFTSYVGHKARIS